MLKQVTILTFTVIIITINFKTIYMIISLFHIYNHYESVIFVPIFKMKKR